MSPLLRTLRRRGYTASLLAFRKLPAPVRRGLVRAVTPGFTVGAVCAIENEGAVLFLRQPHRDGWSLPGGLLDRGERPGDGVQREVREETGLEVRVGLPVTVQVNAAVRRVDVIYRIEVGSRPEVRVGGEAKGHRWLPPSEIDEADAPTLEILDVLARSIDPSAYSGRVLPQG
jgi:ADP-ribose pyrophosphatase YjhB (NUDIX family)